MPEQPISRDVAWKYAIGMMKVDGLKPSRELLDLIEKEKRGEMTTEDMRRFFHKRYEKKNT